MIRFIKKLFGKQTPCASGAHFYGNCKCIGRRGLDAMHEDRSHGIHRDWDLYYKVYGKDIGR